MRAGPEAADQKTVILVTHETTEAAVRKAVDGITKDGHLTDKPQVIRIERREAYRVCSNRRASCKQMSDDRSASVVRTIVPACS